MLLSLIIRCFFKMPAICKRRFTCFWKRDSAFAASVLQLLDSEIYGCQRNFTIAAIVLELRLRMPRMFCQCQKVFAGRVLLLL